MVEFNRDIDRESFSFDRISNFLGNQNWKYLGLSALAVGSYFFLSNRNKDFSKSFSKQTTQSLMTEKPVFCKKETPLQEVAKMMVEHDCGEIPVLDENRKPIGVITDRDITCRTIAKGLNPLSILAEKVMSYPVKTVRLDTPVEECVKLMKKYQIRRLPVVDRNGILTGIISQADIVRYFGEAYSAEFLEKISEPSEKPSRISA